LVGTLSRDRTKDMASDCTRGFADRRATVMPSPAITPKERAIPAPPTRGMFDGLKLRVAPVVALESRAPLPLSSAVQCYARATADILKMRGQGLGELPHRRVASQGQR